MMDSTKTFALLLLLTASYLKGVTQNTDIKVKDYLSHQWVSAGLPLSDLDHLEITDSYLDDATGLTYIYVQQYAGAAPIEHSLATITLKNGEVNYCNADRFIRHMRSFVSSSSPRIPAEDATVQALLRTESKTYLRSKPIVEKEISANHYIYQKTPGVLESIPTQLIYRLEKSNQLKLYWKVSIHQADGAFWVNYIDAENGNVALRKNLTISCSPPSRSYIQNSLPALPFSPSASSQYRVFPLPVTAPNAGVASIVADPADPDASPMGWHDDGSSTYTITRGNNTHTYADPDSNYISAGDEPKAVGNLTFDYPYNASNTIVQNRNAAVVNLFYMTNIMHDFAYNYGFTELAGNFQTKNFTGKGKGNDAVISLADYGSNGTRYRNNSDFLTPPDGGNGRMRMFIWNVSGSKLLKVIDPSSLATAFETGTADFGLAVSTTAVTGKLVLVSDGSSNPTFGCKPLINASTIRNKIALIDRGDCFFHEKACSAQAAGASAVIICNYENTPLGLGAVSPAPCSVTIPVISIGSVDAAFLKKNIDLVTVSIQKPASTGSPDKDGSFDNGIIAHEYGHGISTRLTGGPSNSSCLDNDEQMGEGWSDFMTLVTTASSTDNETTLKGVGTFVLQQEVTDRGIRKYPYTTNMSVNPQTYEDIFTAEVHDLGAVWTAMLWELYWKFTKAYGFDANLYKGKGGNNKAIRLVMEGMKLQPCSPGFVDGRDAILKADQNLYNGENQCLIWEAFAKRGLGYSAKQGSSDDKSDGIQAFDVPPTCTPTVKISKTVTPFIKPGEEISVNITVRNDTKADMTNVVVTDTIPFGATFKIGSSSVTLTQSGSVLSFKTGVVGPGESIGFTYKLESGKNLVSKTVLIDSMENTEGLYDIFALQGAGIWELTDLVSHSGKKSWFVPDQSVDNDQVLNPLIPFDISKLSKPVLRFYHRYKIQNAFDGGIVRISTDGGKSFSDIGKHIFRNSYSGPISFLAIPIPGQRGFYGDTKSAFVPSYIDLSEFKSQPPFYLQFRFGSDDSEGATGWFIDDLELFDMFNYNSQACVTYDGGKVCAEAPAKGTIVESQIITANKDIATIPVNISLFPNPSDDHLNILTHFPKAGEVTGQVYTIDGKLQRTFTFLSNSADTRYKLETAYLPIGMYIMTLKSGKYVGQEKFVIER
jgi:uncharacterized repeat protein (TIGR01451 family)